MAYGGMTVDNQALMEKAEMCRNCKARRRDREKLLRCGKLIRHWISMYRFVDNHSHWQVRALDYERQKRDEAEAKGRRDRARLRRVLRAARMWRRSKEVHRQQKNETMMMWGEERSARWKALKWSAAWKAAAKKWYPSRRTLEEAREILATERLPLSAGAHLKLAAVLREEE